MDTCLHAIYAHARAIELILWDPVFLFVLDNE